MEMLRPRVPGHRAHGCARLCTMRSLPVGQHALLVECTDAEDVAATYVALRARAAELGAQEVVPAATTVLLDGLADPAAAALVLAGIDVETTGQSSAFQPLVELPTAYDGPDLDEVARQWDVSTSEVVRRHQETTFAVRFCGFAPGFAYCSGLDPAWAVARRSEPGAVVPAGSVALAGEWTGVYPRATPGGWQLIGTTTATLWRPDSAEPALLTPGTRVRFVDG